MNANLSLICKYVAAALYGEWAMKVALHAKNIATDEVVISLIKEWFENESQRDDAQLRRVRQVAEHGLYSDETIEDAGNAFDDVDYYDGVQSGIETAIEMIIESKYITC